MGIYEILLRLLGLKGQEQPLTHPRMRELRRIYKVLGYYSESRSLINGISDSILDQQDEAEEQLYNLVVSEPDLNIILRKYNASEDTLRKIYHQLIMAGAGQWAGEHWVAAAAIANQETLGYVLERFKTKELTSSGRDKEIDAVAFNLILYFGEGKPLSELEALRKRF